MSTRAIMLAVVLAAGLPGGAPAAAQAPWLMTWLGEYADPSTRQAVFERMPQIVNIVRLQADLEAQLDTWLKMPGTDETRQRRVIAAFALDAAGARIGIGQPAVDLAEWACRQIRRIRDAGEFERQWHLAAFAVFSGVVDAEALEAHAGHMRLQFRGEPRLLFQRAVAEELRAAPFFEGGRASARDVQRRYEEAASRYREAAKQEAVRGEAQVRLAHVLLRLNKPDEALAAVDAVLDTLDDEDVRYLAHLFRGQALEQLDRVDEARTDYGRALAARPRAQSASMALASLLFREGQRNVADQIVAELLGRSTQPDDPWWDYWPADYRQLKELLANMREALR